MNTMGFKKGDLVYYYQRSTGDTIPCEVIKVNDKTLTLNDGFDTYRRINPRNVVRQTAEHPQYCS